MTELARWTAEAAKGPFDRARAKELMLALISGEAATEEIGRLLLALNSRPTDSAELAGFAEGMLAMAETVHIARNPLVDTCGTGGDGLNTFNISTAAAFVAAGAGAAVAKHGNRSVSSRSGSADVLEALGVRVDAPAEEVRASVENAGFGFFFAPLYHPAMKNVGPARKALGVRTIFNLLGPLANPARVKRQVVGVCAPDLLKTYAEVLLALGAERALVVRGEDGMDELSLAAPTRVLRAEAGRTFAEERIFPEDAGLRSCRPEDLRGGDAKENARLMLEVLEGRPGPLLDATLLNASAALLAAGLAGEAAGGLAGGLAEGVELARRCVRSGKAMGVLEALRKNGKAA